MKNIFFIILTLLQTYCFSQEFSISGKIIDKQTQKPIEAATIYTKSVKDSTLINYTISDNKGFFTLSGRTKESHIQFYITHINNQTYKKKIPTPNKSLEMGNILLETQIQELDAVNVTGETIPITVKKDTLEFNTDAFKLRPDATVEELLKKLPGVEVDMKGNITVNGKPVNEILVNGKPFFSDPKIATKNLTKDIVQKIQVSDTKTEEQKFTGEKGSSENKSINIELKKDKNKGIFGRAAVGYGSKKRYEINGMGNYFNDKLRISVLGSSNNVNTLGFNFDDVYGMMGDASSVSFSGKGNFSINGQNFGTSETGITRSNTMGINFANEWNKTSANGNYFYTHSDLDDSSRTNREITLPTQRYFSESNKEGNYISHSHSATINLSQKIDSTMMIRADFSFGGGKNNSVSHSEEKSLNENRILVNDSKSKNITQSTNTSHNLGISFNKRFAQKGFWGIDLRKTGNDSKNDNRFTNTRTIYTTTPSVTDRNQKDNKDYSQTAIRTRAFLNLPITKNIKLKSSYEFSKTTITDNMEALEADAHGVYNQKNVSLSSDFKTTRFEHKPMAGLSFEYDKLRFDFGSGFSVIQLQNEDFLHNINFEKTYRDMLFTSNLRYEIKKGHTIDVYYRNYVNAPSVYQLQPVENITNPLHSFQGNPELKPASRSFLNVNINKYNWETRSGYFIWFGTDFTNDKVSSITITNPDLTRKTTYTNVDGDYSIYLGSRFNKSYKKEKNTFKVGTTFNVQLSNNISFSNGLRYASKNYSLYPGINLGYNYDDKINIETEYRPLFQLYKYDNNIFESRSITAHKLTFQLTTYMPKNVVFGNDISYQYLPDIGEGFKKSSVYWNMSLGYKFLDDKMTASVKVYDLLNQIVDSNRIVSENYVQDQQFKVLQQYIMFSLSYKLNKAGRNNKRRVEIF